MMAKFEQVDGNPFEVGKYKLVPVSGNPFKQYESNIGSGDVRLKASHRTTLSSPSRFDQTMRTAAGIISPIARPVLEGGGALLGGLTGTLAGLETGPGALATGIIGSGIGYAGGKQAADYLEEYAGIKQPETAKERYIKAVKDLTSGATYEMGGLAAGPIMQAGGRAIGKVAKPLLGRMSGVGTGAIEEALKASSQFDKALRGKISGDDIVDNARAALNSLKDQRANEYLSKLRKVTQSGQQINMQPFHNDLASLMRKYNVKIVNGELDVSRIAMGKKGRNDIAEIIDTISTWGSKQGDTTAEGLDVLKRQLDDFYSDSSQARHFVTSIRNSVKNTIERAVPEYGKMTKGYREATKLIKDIETGLMLRKQGISGRIVADQTLRRLMSSMKDNFTLRKELVNILGQKGGKDLAAQIAGFTMRSPMPVGLAGTGPALIAEAAYATINPKFWPVLAASSPRVQGEFLRIWGRMIGKAYKNKELTKEIVKQTAIYFKRKE